MVSSSSRNSSTSPTVTSYARRNSNYDVFVSFRGEDTRYNFTDFLFDAFQTKGIFAFRDDNNLPKGESIRPELLYAIQHSQIYVVVFSRNYASSIWCLQELVKICECVQMSGKHVLPVFYDVDPSDVRHQKGMYAEAFAKHEHRFQHDSQMVPRWRKALTQVANLAGWDLRHKPQSTICKKIVQKTISILDCISSSISKDLVGMDSHIKELEKLLLLKSVVDVRVVGICGKGGIGKTTLATVLYDQISQQFGACCFIDDVSKIYRLHGPLGLQKEILDQTLGQKHHQICNQYNAANLIRRRLCRQKALMILDNVDHIEQLEKITVHREWLSAGSRIIIISRDEHILNQYGVDAVYQVPLLNWTNSRKLLCRKAFKPDHILSSYKGLVNGILNYANGLPLAIKVLGSFLFGRDISEWKSTLASLRENPDKDVMDVLRLSFDGLRETEKEIFLHIACFFNKHMETYVKNVLNCCEFHADIGLRVLIDKSLVSTQYGLVVMHNLLEELGRKIVQENTSKESRKWSRLWFHKQLYYVMLENMEKNVEAIVLYHQYGVYEDMDAVIFEDFSNLRLLIIKNRKVSGSLNRLSNELRYIEWSAYPFMYLPSSFQPNQLVELILNFSSIKQLWEGKKNLPKLKILDLSHSKNLLKMPYFGEFPNLELLNLEECTKLVLLDPSIGLLRKIVSLNLKDCKSLVNIPNNIFDLSTLKELNLSRCCFKEFNNSRHLDIPETTSHSQSTSSICKWATKPYHSLFPTPTTNTVMFPSLLTTSCLREVDMSYCGLSQVPEVIGCFRWLEMLNLRGNNFVTLPSLRELSKLVYLNLEHCKRLESLPELPSPTTIEQDLRKNKYWKRTGFLIFNCPKISDKEQCSRRTFSWMTRFIQVNKEYPAFFEIGIVIPGSEIPSWFNNQSDGNSIPVSPIMQDNGNNMVGFLCCIVFSIEPYYPTMTRSKRWRPRVEMTVYPPLSITAPLPVIVDENLITVKSNHIWLIYFPWESSNIDQYDDLFVKADFNEDLHVEVMKCGYRWVYKHDLQ